MVKKRTIELSLSAGQDLEPGYRSGKGDAFRQRCQLVVMLPVNSNEKCRTHIKTAGRVIAAESGNGKHLAYPLLDKQSLAKPTVVGLDNVIQQLKGKSN